MNILLKNLTLTLSLVVGLQAIEIENTNLENSAPKVASLFLTAVVVDSYIKHDFKQFIQNVSPLREVCKDWNQTIDKDFMHKAMVLGCQQVCPGFLNSKLMYKPTQKSDEGIVVFNISDLWNPQEGEFIISSCNILDKNGIRIGNASRFLSISTGYRKEKKAENAGKLEIWLMPKPLVVKDLGTTAAHLKPIMDNWKEEVGVSWTWGGWDNMDWYDSQTSISRDNLSKNNLYEQWKMSKGRFGGIMITGLERSCARHSCARHSCFFLELN